eukprot:RCo027142
MLLRTIFSALSHLSLPFAPALFCTAYASSVCYLRLQRLYSMSDLQSDFRSSLKTVASCTSSASYVGDPAERNGTVTATPNPLSVFLDIPRGISNTPGPSVTAAAAALPHRVQSLPSLPQITCSVPERGFTAVLPGSDGRPASISTPSSKPRLLQASPVSTTSQPLTGLCRKVPGGGGHPSRACIVPSNLCTDSSTTNLLIRPVRDPGPVVLTERCVRFLWTPCSAVAAQAVFIAVAVASSWLPEAALWLPHLLWAAGCVLGLVLRWNHQRRYHQSMLEEMRAVLFGDGVPKSTPRLSSDPFFTSLRQIIVVATASMTPPTAACPLSESESMHAGKAVRLCPALPTHSPAPCPGQVPSTAPSVGVAAKPLPMSCTSVSGSGG